MRRYNAQRYKRLGAGAMAGQRGVRMAVLSQYGVVKIVGSEGGVVGMLHIWRLQGSGPPCTVAGQK